MYALGGGTSILEEEMRRILAFLSWHTDWWDQQATHRPDLEAATQEGLASYARRQATIRRALRQRFKELWLQVPAIKQFWTKDEGVSIVE